MKNGLYILVILFFVSCGSVKVNYDFDRKTDFSSFTTYNFYSDLETGLNPLDTKRFLKAMDIALQEKGLIFSEEPDFLINVISVEVIPTMNNTVGVGLGGGGNTIGGGVTVGIPIGKKAIKREIVIDFVAVNRNIMFWQAKAISSFKEGATPEVKEAKFQDIANKIFEKYPPRVKKQTVSKL